MAIRWLSVPLLTLAGCAADLEHIPFDRVERLCGQQCSRQYSQCQSDWTAFAPYQSHRCGEDLESCVASCPPNTAAAIPNAITPLEGT